jgi:excisionase family DNA binding protein
MAVLRAGQVEEVLTLAEAAAFLRATEDALLALVAEDAIPAQKIGGEWRFLKRALADWLRYGHQWYREFRGFPPPWMFDSPLLEEWMTVLEKRLLSRMAASNENLARPGSKEAVRKHFGVWRDDPTAKGMLADIYKRRRDEPKGEE